MLYEIKKKRLNVKEPVCIFCEGKVNLSDYWCLCKSCGKQYFKIPFIFRLILPKIIVRAILHKL